MAKVYRTAMGKSVDLDSLRLSNEDAIAVGNMKVNARGDKLGPGGQVTEKRNQTMDAHYKINTPAVSENNAYAAKQLQAQQGARISDGHVDPAGESFEPPADVVAAAEKAKGAK